MLLVIGVGVIGSYEIADTDYFHQLTSRAEHNGLAGTFAKDISWRLREFGEIVANVPQSKTPEAVRPALSLIGAVALALFTVGLWSRRRFIGALELYLVAYCAIIFAWPFYDTRFWLPVIPLLAAFVWIGAARVAVAWRPLEKCLVPATCAHLALYVFLGAVAMIYSTRITFAGESFPVRFGDGTLTETYRAAFGQPHDEREVFPEALRLLGRYGGIAVRHRWGQA